LMVNEHEPLNYPRKILSAYLMDAGFIIYIYILSYLYIYMYNYTYHVACASVTVATDKLSN